VDRVDEDPGTLSLEATFREHRLALLRLACLVGASRELAEDVVQSAFASAQSRWDRVDQALPYLKRAVVNQVKDDQRRWYRRRHVALPLPPGSVLPPEIDETWGVIASLPWPQRAAIVLHYYEDLPLSEVAEVLGRPAATVRSDHRRALERLRKALA
jgi:DNA-directed RNA polymerase specialized sigma24 family protein